MWDGDEYELLASAIAHANCVVVVEGPTYDPRNRTNNSILCRATDQQSILDMQHALQTGTGTRMDWMTLGHATIAFLLDRDLLAAVNCIGPDYIRCEELWMSDAPLADPAALEDWLRGHGVELTR